MKSGVDADYADLSGLRVVVVEDDADSREILVDLLEDQGAEVQGADSAEHALGVLATWWPHVLVSDIGLPDLDGYALLARVRSAFPGKTIAAVALTGYTSADERVRASAAGFVRHVAKPIEGAALTRAVAEAARVR